MLRCRHDDGICRRSGRSPQWSIAAVVDVQTDEPSASTRMTAPVQRIEVITRAEERCFRTTPAACMPAWPMRSGSGLF